MGSFFDSLGTQQRSKAPYNGGELSFLLLKKKKKPKPALILRVPATPNSQFRHEDVSNTQTMVPFPQVTSPSGNPPPSP